MRTQLRRCIDGIRDLFGHPASLIRLIEEHPDIYVSLDTPRQCIDAQSVVPWHELGLPPIELRSHLKHGDLLGHGEHSSLYRFRSEYCQIALCEITEDWMCDISDVHGFSASKSELRNFGSIDEMAETRCPSMIDEITPEKLAKNLAHREIRIIHSPGSDRFRRYLWDGRLFLMNHGGSHHFAAAKYIAARLQRSVPLKGTLHTYSLNSAAIASLRRDFEMFVIADSWQIWPAFIDAMEGLKATWLWHHMPAPFDNGKAILLPKPQRRSMRVAALLRQAGLVDLGTHLADLAAGQSK